MSHTYRVFPIYRSKSHLKTLRARRFNETFLVIFKMKHPVKDVQMLVLRVFRYFLFKKQVKKVLKYPKENSPSIVLIFLSIFSGETIECEKARKNFYTTTQKGIKSSNFFLETTFKIQLEYKPIWEVEKVPSFFFARYENHRSCFQCHSYRK